MPRDFQGKKIIIIINATCTFLPKLHPRQCPSSSFSCLLRQLHFGCLSAKTLNPSSSTPLQFSQYFGFTPEITGRQCTRTPASFCLRIAIGHRIFGFCLRNNFCSFSLNSIHFSGILRFN